MATRVPQWKFAEQTPSGSQTRLKTATTQAQPETCTLEKPADPQKQAPAQAQAQAQIWPPAPAQPIRPAPAYFPQPQALPPRGGGGWSRGVPSESLIVKDRISDFPDSETSLIGKQALSELLDRVANFCVLERGDSEEQKRVMGMKHPCNQDPASHH